MKKCILLLLTILLCSICSTAQSLDMEKELERLEEIRTEYGDLSKEYINELNGFCKVLENAGMTSTYEYYSSLYALFIMNNYYGNEEKVLQIAPKLEPLIFRFSETPVEDAFVFYDYASIANIKAGSYSEAIRQIEEESVLLPKLFYGDTLLVMRAQVMIELSDIHEMSEDNQEAVHFLKNGKEIIDSLCCEVWKRYGEGFVKSYHDVLFRLLDLSYRLGEFDMALDISSEIEPLIGIYSDNPIQDATLYVSCMYSICTQLGKYEEALLYCNDLIGLLSTQENKELLVESLIMKAEVYHMLGQNEESLACLNNCKRYMYDIQMNDCLLKDKMMICHLEGHLVSEYDEAMAKLDTALFICNQQMEKANSFLSSYINNPMSLDNYSNDNNDTIFIDATKKLEDFQYYYSLVFMSKGDIQAKFGKIKEAYQSSLEGVRAFPQVKTKNNTNYLQLLINVAGLQMQLGNYSDAINTIDGTMRLIEDRYGTNTPYYAYCLLNSAMYYFNTGDKEKALFNCEKAVQAFYTIFGEKSIQYYQAIIALGGCYSSSNPQKAYQYLSEAEVLNDKIEVFPVTTCELYTLMARVLIDLDQYEEGITYYEKAKELIGSIYGYESLGYAYFLAGFGRDMYDLNIGEEISFESFSTTISIINKLDLTYDPLCYKSLIWYGWAGFEFDKTLVSDFILRIIDAAKDYYTYNMAFYSTKERDVGITSYSDVLDVVFSARKNVIYDQKIYDLLLFTKSLMIKNTEDFKEELRNYEQSELPSQYNNIRAIQRTIDNLCFGMQSDDLSLELLYDRKTSMERDLMAEMKALGYSANDIITYDDARRALKEDQVAIEFVDFYHLKDKKTYYVALLAKSNWDKPVYVQLCTEDELKACLDNPNVTYSTDDLYRLLWQPLSEYIDDSSTVYFSPSGMLHTIALESLHTLDGSCLSDKYNLVRLTSTRELCKEKQTKSYETGAVYGGLQYDVEQQRMAEVAALNKTELEESHAFALRGEDRGNWNYLQGTKDEAEHIAGIMQQANIGCNLFEGDLGSEESFKALSGGSTDIIHLATHGYFLENEKADMNDFMKSLSPLARQKTDSIIDPLLRSGLILSGGNRAWLGKEVPEGIEDGVLTALEISTMNLSGTDMVVMSACETGLGDITSDGVFGLQRAFKMAGVQTLVMSLWKVDDNATSLMMQTFYEHLLSGMSKREAFNLAQAAVRTKYPEPYYWAGFVMLD